MAKSLQADALNAMAEKALAEVLEDYLTSDKKRQIKRIAARIPEEVESSGNVTIIHWRYKPTCCDLCYFCEKGPRCQMNAQMVCLLKDR